MKKDEAVEVLSMIEGAYPHFMKGTAEQVKGRVKVWMYHLQKMDYQKTIDNLHGHIEKSEYPPSIAEIRPYKYEFDSAMAKVEAVFEDD